jgi:hypothetical protein
MYIQLDKNMFSDEFTNEKVSLIMCQNCIKMTETVLMRRLLNKRESAFFRELLLFPPLYLLDYRSEATTTTANDSKKLNGVARSNGLSVKEETLATTENKECFETEREDPSSNRTSPRLISTFPVVTASVMAVTRKRMRLKTQRNEMINNGKETTDASALQREQQQADEKSLVIHLPTAAALQLQEEILGTLTTSESLSTVDCATPVVVDPSSLRRKIPGLPT